jgi:hypothetical protein
MLGGEALARGLTVADEGEVEDGERDDHGSFF